MSIYSTYQTEFFSLYEVAEGVFAAIEKDHNAGSNAGIIDLGDRTVVFDTFLNIDAAKALHSLCRELTGRDASYLINSHYHLDHIVGNSLFGEAAVISTEATREKIVTARADLEKELDNYRAQLPKLEAALSRKSDPSEIANLSNSLMFLKNLTKPGVEIRVPDVTFTDRLELHGTKRSLCLRSFEIAHTGGDVIAWLPDSGVCFLGDMLCKGVHPWLGNGDPEKLLDALEVVSGMGLECLVPGHGALAGKEDLQYMKQYIQEIMRLVNATGSNKQEDYTPDALSSVSQDWDSLCFSWNIRFLTGRQNT